MTLLTDGQIELAMTHVVGANGERALCQRPREIRAAARRVNAWRDAPAVCQSCSAHDAKYLRAGMALCPSCRENRAVAEGDVDVLNRRAQTIRNSLRFAGAGFDGYSIVFNSWSVDLGGFVERIRPQAMNRTFEEQIDVRGLWNHNSDTVLARLSAGSLTLEKDATGLKMRMVPPSGYAVQRESVERRDVTGQSFGFYAIDDEWNFDADTPQRDVLDMRVSEVSIVAFPAYPKTSVAVAEFAKEGRSQAWYDTRIRLAR